MYKYTFILFSFILLSACSPQRRLERLLERHPELRVQDTLKICDTLRIPGDSADTVLPLGRMRDTIYLEKGRLQILLRKVHDTLVVRGKCKPDTVIIRRQIPVEKIRIVKSSAAFELVRKIPWIVTGFMVVAGLVVFLVLRH
jgi:hypothetical protein